jgi:AcrR family transcriptional regulator
MRTQTLRERLRESTSAAILDAAEEVAAKEGLAGASLQAIAHAAGIAVGTIYNYFDDRQKLIDALFTRRKEELYEAIDDAAKKHAKGSFEVQLDAFVRAAFTHFDARRRFLRIALSADHKPLLVKGEDGRKRPAMQQLWDRAERIVRVGMREKRLREEGADLFATVLSSILRGVLVSRIEDETPLTAQTERVVSLFLHGAAR